MNSKHTMPAAIIAICAATFVVSEAAIADFVAVSIDADGGTQLVGLGESSSGGNIGTLSQTHGFDNCNFDGTDTVCTVSGTYTEDPSSTINPGATGSFVWTQSYAGDGPNPLIVETTEPFGTTIRIIDFGAASYSLDLVQDSGPDLFLQSGFGWGFFFSGPTASCSGLAPLTDCSIGEVGLVPGATVQAPYTTFSLLIAEEVIIPLPAGIWLFSSCLGACMAWARKRTS